MSNVTHYNSETVIL